MNQQLSLQTYSTILDALPYGAFVVNNEWRIQYINEPAKQMLKVSETDVVGKICQQLFQADACANHCPLAITLKSGKRQYDRRVVLKRSDGLPITISVSTSFIKSDSDVLLGGIVTFRALEMDAPRTTHPYVFAGMIGTSQVMQDLFKTIQSLRKSRATVMIYGESGTGKERLARAIHLNSPVSDGPFLAISCGAIPDTLLESELFGHRKGAFTDAKAHHTGYFERASGGTLFLDEIAEASPMLQVKLLRVLEEQRITPVGGEESIPVSVRIVTASNRDLLDEVKQRRFREDLFYRLAVVHLNLPPLRERTEDIPFLVSTFLEKARMNKETEFESVSDEALKLLQSFEWNGNVRQLENAISYAVAIGEGTVLLPKHLPNLMTSNTQHLSKTVSNLYLEALQSGVNPLLLALAQSNNRVNEAAKLLGISRITFWRRLKALQNSKHHPTIRELNKETELPTPVCEN